MLHLATVLFLHAQTFYFVILISCVKMYSISTDETKWPEVAAHHYIRSIARRRVRILVVLSFVLCFFWQVMKRPLPEELDVLLKELNPWGSDSALGLPRSCMAVTEGPLPVFEPRQSYSHGFPSKIKPQQTETLVKKALSKKKEDVSESILDRELTNEMPEEGTWKQKNIVDGLMVSPQSRWLLQWSDDNQVKYQVQQQDLSQAAIDGIEEKTSKPLALRTKFPEYSEFLALNSTAETLPDVIHIPFEDATANMTLTGWEDEWFSKVEYDVGQWGNLSEPKIDFIYSCKSTFQHVYSQC
jgi:hypothetical protein